MSGNKNHSSRRIFKFTSWITQGTINTISITTSYTRHKRKSDINLWKTSITTAHFLK